MVDTLQASHPDKPKMSLKMIHYKLLHPDDIIRCISPTCKKEFVHPSDMQQHYQRFHLKQRIRCKFCPAELYIDRVYLRKHLEEAHAERVSDLNILCDHPGCDAKYASKATLNLHKRNKHRKSVKGDTSRIKENCSICGGSYLKLKQHLIAMHGDKQFSCQYCGKAFGEKSPLDVHLKYVHLKAVRELVPCPTCGKRMQKRCLKEHIAMVHKKIRYDCVHCAKSYSMRADMISHVQAVHYGQKIKCRFCCHEFGRTSDRNRHERQIHSGVESSAQ